MHRCKNGKKIFPSKTTKIEDALIGIDLNSIKLENIVTKLEKLLNIGKHFRHFGANAQEICYVADGSLDAFIDIRGKLRVTDIVASYLIIRESGGILVSPEGKELNVLLSPTQKLSFIAAGNLKLYDEIKEVLIR